MQKTRGVGNRNLTRTEYLAAVRKRLKNNIIINDNSCWIWQGRIHKSKTNTTHHYGQTCFVINKKKRNHMAHRVSYMVFVGDIPQGMFVLHKCDVPLCINPEHLMLGDQRENMRQMRERDRANDWKRGKQGEKHNKAKLTNQQVLKIRELRKKGYSILRLEKIFNVSNVLISKICRKEIWRHI